LFATNRDAGPDARRVLVTRQQSEFRLRELLMSAIHEDWIPIVFWHPGRGTRRR